jgi:transposase-like protein
MGNIDEAGAGGSSCDCERIASARFWSSDEKRRMVAESFALGASVLKVAQRYGVNAWSRVARVALDGPLCEGQR